MGCPYWKEVVMVYCEASPIKKLVPIDRLVQAGRCLCPDFENCPAYRDAVARLQRSADGSPPDAEHAARKEPS